MISVVIVISGILKGKNLDLMPPPPFPILEHEEKDLIETEKIVKKIHKENEEKKKAKEENKRRLERLRKGRKDRKMAARLKVKRLRKKKSEELSVKTRQLLHELGFVKDKDEKIEMRRQRQEYKKLRQHAKRIIDKDL